jgi:hypothetical protein
MTELGIAELDGRERWRQPPEGSYPRAARAGWIAGTANAGGLEIGWNAGDSWDRVPASREWNSWQMAMGEHRTSRFLATRMGGTDPALYLLAAHEGGRAAVVWSTPDADVVGAPSEIIPCAGFAGETLHVVVRDRQADASGWHHGKLVTVGPDGRARERVLVGQMLDDAGLTCEIAGNDRAAFLVLNAPRRTLNWVVRIDLAEPRNETSGGSSFERIDVDAHGQFMFLAHGCVSRMNDAGNQNTVVCGPDRS